MAKKGAFQQFFAVYGRDGENCSNSDCKNKIKKIICQIDLVFIVLDVKNNKVDQ